MKLRIFSVDNDSWKIRVENAETGEPLQGVRNVSISIPLGGPAIATIEVLEVLLGVNAQVIDRSFSELAAPAKKLESAETSGM